MNKKYLLLSLILTAISYGADTEIKLEKSVITSATGFATDVRDIASNPKVITSEQLEEKNMIL